MVEEVGVAEYRRVMVEDRSVTTRETTTCGATVVGEAAASESVAVGKQVAVADEGSSAACEGEAATEGIIICVMGTTTECGSRAG